MKRWEEILREPPSDPLTQLIEARVFAEMRPKPKPQWHAWAALAMGVAAVLGGRQFLRRSWPEEASSEEGRWLMELAQEDSLDLDVLEDLEVLEILEELEQWPNG